MKLPIVSMGLPRPLEIEETPVTAPFWQGLQSGDFLLSTCNECGRRSFPPKAICPSCHHQDFHWAPSSGRGVIYSLTRIQNSPPIYGLLTPTTLAIIDLEDSIRLLCRVLPGPKPAEVGSPCQLVITKHPDGWYFGTRLL